MTDSESDASDARMQFSEVREQQESDDRITDAAAAKPNDKGLTASVPQQERERERERERSTAVYMSGTAND
eukprot:2242753-Pyramimonas_sp.AAC.1